MFEFVDVHSVHVGFNAADAQSPPFRPLTLSEDAAVVEQINASGARLVFVELGSPKQEHFAYEHRDRIQTV